MKRGPKIRPCIACGAKAITAYLTDGYFNCVTGQLADGISQPGECWSRRFPTLAEPFLQALRPVKVQGKTTKAFFEKKTKFALGIIELEQQGELTAETLKPLVEAIGRIFAGKFIASLSNEFAIKEKLQCAYRGTRTPKLPKTAAQKEKAEPLELPDEFERALAVWSDISHRRAERQKKIGNSYHPRTAIRRVNDARRFLEFLVKNGVTNWANVSQIHLDDFTVKTNRRLAQKAFMFWNAIRSHFPMQAKLVRPRNKRDDPIMNHIISESQYKSVLTIASRSEDAQIALCLLFVAVYAQTVTKSAELDRSDTRRIDGGYQIRFNEVWVPLDPMTQGVLERRLAEIDMNSLREGTNLEKMMLFSYSAKTLFYLISKVTNLDLKPIRLTAVRRLLQNGYTDRKGIELALGVSMQTVRIVEKSCGWDLQNYVPEAARTLRKDLLNGKIN